MNEVMRVWRIRMKLLINKEGIRLTSSHNHSSRRENDGMNEIINVDWFIDSSKVDKIVWNETRMGIGIFTEIQKDTIRYRIMRLQYLQARLYRFVYVTCMQFSLGSLPVFPLHNTLFISSLVSVHTSLLTFLYYEPSVNLLSFPFSPSSKRRYKRGGTSDKWGEEEISPLLILCMEERRILLIVLSLSLSSQRNEKER